MGGRGRGSSSSSTFVQPWKREFDREGRVRVVVLVVTGAVEGGAGAGSDVLVLRENHEPVFETLMVSVAEASIDPEGVVRLVSGIRGNRDGKERGEARIPRVTHIPYSSSQL